MGTHSQNLLSGDGSYIPVSGSEEKSESATYDLSTSGTGQGSGEEHIKFGGVESAAVSRGDADSDSESSDVFDNFGNKIEEDEDSSISMPVV